MINDIKMNNGFSLGLVYETSDKNNALGALPICK
jgi:hypothetical protein